MTGITSIYRDFNESPNIVRITTTDTIATASAASYILNQATNITLANNGVWGWLASDWILCACADGDFMGLISSDFKSIIPTTFVSSTNGAAGFFYAAGVQSGYVNVPMTLTQWQNMYTTPIQIVPAAGAGTLLSFRKGIVYLTYGSAALVSGGAVGFQLGNSAHLAGTKCSNTEQASDFTGAAANTSYFFGAASGNGSEATDGSNLGIFISNDTGVWTGGTGDTFNVHCWYDIVTLP